MNQGETQGTLVGADRPAEDVHEAVAGQLEEPAEDFDLLSFGPAYAVLFDGEGRVEVIPNPLPDTDEDRRARAAARWEAL